MSWVSDYKYRWYEKLALNLIRAGGTPDHVAFVMDGNRRYAKSEHIPQIDGHSHGFTKLADCLRWCLDLGIRKVTVFAFSIENFKRSEGEVNGLLDLAREKFKQLLQEKAKLDERGVRVNTIGNISLLPKDLQQLIARAMLETKENNQLFLNIAFAYTSRDEMTQAVESILLHGDQLTLNDINEPLLKELLYEPVEPGPDLLIRTSGETRISDFLMWQVSNTVLYFTKNLWPQITIWNLLAAIMTYQRSRRQENGIKPINQSREVSKLSSTLSQPAIHFLKCFQDLKKSILLNLSVNSK